jgi:hypothetical protein
MDQLFYIGMTLTGFGWSDLLALTDRDRLALIERCTEYHDAQKREMDSVKSKAR